MRKASSWKLIVVALLLAGLTVSPAAAPKENTVAKCNDGRDNDRDGLIDDADPDCQGLDDGGGEEVPLPDNEVGWRGAVQDQEDGTPATRRCLVAFSTPDGSDIAYDCSINEPPTVFIDLAGIPSTQTRRKGDPVLCDFFNGGFEFTPLSEYDFRLLESCPAGAVACEMRAQIWSHVDVDGVGLVTFAGFGNVAGATDNPNPFSEAQVVDIFEIVASFKQLGTNKTIATCRYDPADGEVQFHTEPQP